MLEEARQVGISNTEVQNAYTCEQAWAFGFHPDWGYQVRDMGVARTRGILGHKALEIFYQNLKETEDHDKSAQEALNYIQAERLKELKAGDFADPDRLGMLNWLHETLDVYFEWYQDDIKNWEILEVEAFHAQEQEGETDFYLPSRLDLVIYQKSGKYKGETSPVDHKFTDLFWTPWKLKLNSQFPLYILALRAARYAGKPKPVVSRVIVNQIRTRPAANPTGFVLFQRVFQDYPREFMNEVFRNHMKSAVYLAYLKRLPLDEAKSEIRAALGSQACKFCDFKDLCLATFEGRDPSNVIAATLKPNEYGYPPLEVIRRERAD